MPSIDGTASQPLTRRLQRSKSRKGRFLLATFQEVVDSIHPDAACLQVLFPVRRHNRSSSDRREHKLSMRNRGAGPDHHATDPYIAKRADMLSVVSATGRIHTRGYSA